jgi:hypothetical protein
MLKTTFTLGFLLLFVAVPAAVGTGLSAITNGVYLAVGAPGSTNEPVRFDEELLFLPFCDTGQVELNLSSPPYGIKIRMWGGDGQDVPKTALGKSFGSKWDSFEDSLIERKGLRLGYYNLRRASIFAWGPFTNNPGLGGGKVLPTPKDLFQMEKPGVYTLEIQMQMLRVNKGTNQLTRQLIRFAPVRVRVEKPRGTVPEERVKH